MSAAAASYVVAGQDEACCSIGGGDSWDVDECDGRRWPVGVGPWLSKELMLLIVVSSFGVCTTAL